MTTITANVICDSINSSDIRLTTLELEYPRFIHAELLTHRVFSRNSASSRAIPVKRLIESVQTNPAMPIHWGKNQPGMQANEECNNMIQITDDHLGEMHGLTMIDREHAWLKARDKAVEFAKAYSESGYHKQIVNRLLEPFAHIRVVVSSTFWDNFFQLRYHKDAQPEIYELAKQIKEKLHQSTPTKIKYGQWHLPYITPEEKQKYDYNILKKISVARCASVSYKTVDGQEMTPEKALNIYDKLYISKPFHASPFEHVATPNDYLYEEEVSSNFHDSWVQWRKILEVNNDNEIY